MTAIHQNIKQQAVTVDELSKQTGKTRSQVKGWHFRNREKFSLGSFCADDLHPLVVHHFTTGSKPTPGKPKTTELEPIKPELQTVVPEPKKPRTGTDEQELETAPKPAQNQEPQTTEPTSGTGQLSGFLLFNPNARFVCVMALMAGGAYIFTRLVDKVYPDELNAFSYVVFFAVGFLVDASGLVLAQSYKRTDKFDSAEWVWFFLVVLFMVQVCIESSYVFWETGFSWVGLLVSSVRPLGQLVYSAVYLESGKNGK